MRSEQRAEYYLEWADYSLTLGQRTNIMGVINVTPDSFADGGLYFHTDKAIEHGLSLALDGADIIDVGGESTRPFSKEVSVQEELDRVIPVIEGLRREIDIPISIDTFKAEVARQALRAGAAIINDISALNFDPEMALVAAEAGVPLVLMHIKGTPAHMQENPTYNDLIPEILEYLKNAVDHAKGVGVREEMIIIDPGIGFGKTFDHNLEILQELDRFHTLRRPILLGTSRKAFIGHILGKEPSMRDTGTMATVSAGILKGVHIVRVHNVKETVDTVKVIDAIMRGRI